MATRKKTASKAATKRATSKSLTGNTPQKKATEKALAQTQDEFLWHANAASMNTSSVLKQDIVRHIVSSLGNDYIRKDPYVYYHGLALAVRDRLIDQWIRTQRSYYDAQAKRVYYLSLEYLPGKSLKNNLHCIGLYDTARQALDELGVDFEEVHEIEWDAGLGNGGLGRLASCYLDSMATLGVPGYGYGIRYDFGIFHQAIRDGWQVEQPDNWTRRGNPWEFQRNRHLFPIGFYGRVETKTDARGKQIFHWAPSDIVQAMACDMMVPGYQNGNVINMRLWAARSDEDFNLEFFNTGNYIGAVQHRINDETISKVLYPNDEISQGRELRLKQQYFFVAATMTDIMRRFTKKNDDFTKLPDRVAIQLNDTHPSIAVPELMRVLVDGYQVPWDTAWDICQKTFAYTNHTVLPEALETWPEELIRQVLPRHLQIIHEINRRFLNHIGELYPGDTEKLQRMSIVQEEGRRIRMANLAIVGSHSVNGVAALHTDIIKNTIFKDFDEAFPGRINNKTNGVTPRRWLKQCNLPLAALLDEAIGQDWVTNLDQLKQLVPLAADKAFRQRWRGAKQENKKALAAYIQRRIGLTVDSHSLFDVQVKRIHEYKRQLMNALHAIALYRRIKADPGYDALPRTIIFGGKAAPGYHMAKLIIRLIGGIAETVNSDPDMNGKLKVVFLPNYCVSQAERIIPATELSEQISMAGMEASGTGNMKFALNGALTIGTLDGANVEIRDEVGADNIFIFGNTLDELADLRVAGYNPSSFLRDDPELVGVMDRLVSGLFSRGDTDLFRPIHDALLKHGDHFFVLADFRRYVQCQAKVEEAYKDRDEWTRMSILNTANMGKFSSDRSVTEYAREIWKASLSS